MAYYALLSNAIDPGQERGARFVPWFAGTASPGMWELSGMGLPRGALQFKTW